MSPLGEHAKLIASTLAALGIRDVVASPGSRSTPFLHAVLAEPLLRVHTIVDERAAGFFALGRAKVDGRPVALLSTSGSAPAHYYPAVIEAEASHVPLVVLSADRPARLVGCGANQTIDQVALFGAHVRAFLDVSAPGPRAEEVRAVRRAIAQTVLAASSPVPGPVHLNLRADKPLEPRPAAGAEELRAEAIAEAVSREPLTRAGEIRRSPDTSLIDALAAALAAAERPLLVAGPAPIAWRRIRSRVLELARRTGMPVLAEATSQLRFTGAAREDVVVLDAFDAVLDLPAGRGALAPDFVLGLGAVPTSRGFDLLCAEAPALVRYVVTEHGWPDPHGTATAIVHGDLEATLDALLARVAPRPRNGFAEHVRALDALASAACESVLGGPVLGEADVARTLVAALPEGALLSIGNSLPVRNVDLYAPGGLADVAVLHQRGVSGIDGLVAGAAGAAGAWAGPTVLYLGDVSLLHDIGALAAARGLDASLTIVVAHNGGGRIFAGLPVATAPLLAGALDRFVTPHDTDFEPAARLFGHRYARVETAGALRDALRESLSHRGCTLIEARIAPGAALRERAAVSARIDAALAPPREERA